MSQSTYDLIGRIINPGPHRGPRTAAAAPAFPTAGQPVDVLIGRIIHPHGPPRVVGLRVENIATDAVTPLERPLP